MERGEHYGVEGARVLVVLSDGREREEIRRRLAAAEPGFRVVACATPAEALPLLEAGRADAVLGDLEALAGLRETPAGSDAVFCLLVPPGAEAEAALLLESEPAEFLVQRGDYYSLLPALLRRALGRAAISAGDVARLIRHELNNPLTGVLGNAELILAEDAALTEKTRRRLRTIIQLAVRLRDVLRELEERLGGSEEPPTLTRPNSVARAAPATRAPL